jgi:hypothetical protein
MADVPFVDFTGLTAIVRAERRRLEEIGARLAIVVRGPPVLADGVADRIESGSARNRW